MSEPLCYGDIVYLRLDDEFLLYSAGLVEPQVYMVSQKDILNKAFRNCLFQILPNFDHKDTSDLNRQKTQLQILSDLNPDAVYAKEVLESDLKLEDELSKAKESKRKHLNQKIYEESKGQPIQFGKRIQLLHYESQKYLKVTDKYHEGHNGMNLLKLSEKETVLVYFRVMPANNNDVEGDIVKYGSKIKILGSKNEYCIVPGPDANLDRSKKVLGPATNPLLQDQLRFPEVYSRKNQQIFEFDKAKDIGIMDVFTPKFCSFEMIPFQTQASIEVQMKKKYIKNGDYIRITDGKSYLNGFKLLQARPDYLSFRHFPDSDFGKFHNLNTIFQIILVNDPSEIPLGISLKRVERKRFHIKSLATGCYLSIKDKDFVLSEKPNDQSIAYIDILRSQASFEDSPLDHNSILSIIFEENGQRYSLKVQGEILESSKRVPHINKGIYGGSPVSDEMINRFSKLQTKQAKLNLETGQDYHFKFESLNVNEIASVNMVEGFANKLLQFCELIALLRDPKTSSNLNIRHINTKIKEISKCIEEMFEHMFEEEHNLLTEELLTADLLKQNLLRNFNVLDLLFFILYYLSCDFKVCEQFQSLKDRSVKMNSKASFTRRAEDKKISQKLNRIIQVGSKNHSPDQMSRVNSSNTKSIDDIQILEKKAEKNDEEDYLSISKSRIENDPDDDDTDINHEYLLQLINSSRKVILITMKNNKLNKLYCSQYFRTSYKMLIYGNKHLFNSANSKTQSELKKFSLHLCQKLIRGSLSKHSLGYLNERAANIFEAIKNQRTFHTGYIKFIDEIAKIESMDLESVIVDRFANDFISKKENIQHVFPMITFDELEEDIRFTFKRLLVPEDISFTINQMVSRLKEDHEDRVLIENLIYYTTAVMNLITSLSHRCAGLYQFRIIKYYSQERITETVKRLPNDPLIHEMKIAMSEMSTTIYQNYFLIYQMSLPSDIQFSHKNSEMEADIEEINRAMKNSINKIISDEEWDFIKQERYTQEIEKLKSKIAQSGIEAQVENLMKENKSLSRGVLKDARLIVEELITILEGKKEVSLQFLKLAHSFVLNYLQKSVMGSNIKATENLVLIKNGLKALPMIESKIVMFAGYDVISSLKEKNLLDPEISSSPKIDAKRTSNLAKSSGKLDEEQYDKESVEKYKNALIGVINDVTGNWRSRESLFLTEEEMQNLSITQNFKRDSVIKLLIQILNFNEYSLTKEVIDHMKVLCSFEASLNTQLKNLVLLSDKDGVSRCGEIVTATLSLNRISRQMLIIKQTGLEIEPETLTKCLMDMLETCWNLFFSIYDPEKHYKYPDVENSRKRFKDDFKRIKSLSYDPPFLPVGNAIRKDFQIAFRVLKTYKSLVRNINWIKEVYLKKKSEKSLISLFGSLIRLIYMILIVFVYENEINQVALAHTRNLILDLKETSQSEQFADMVILLCEIMRNNKINLSLKDYHIFDLVLSLGMRTLAEITVKNDDKKGASAASLYSLSYLLRCPLRKENFDPVHILKTKWEDLVSNNQFPSMKLQFKAKMIHEPICYYSHRELIRAFSVAAKYFKDDSAIICDLRGAFNFKQFITYFKQEFIHMQFEIKKLLCVTVNQLFFTYVGKGNFVDDTTQIQELLSYLFNDILFMKDYLAKYKKEDNSKLLKIVTEPNFLSINSMFIEQRKYYAAYSNLDLNTFRIILDMEAVPLFKMLSDYIYNGCLDLIFSIILKSPAICKEKIDGNNSTAQSVLQIVLHIIHGMAISNYGDPDFPYKKIEKFLGELTIKKEYIEFKNMIVNISSNLNEKQVKLKEDQPNETPAGRNIASPLEIYSQQINQMLEYNQNGTEMTMEQLARDISTNENYDSIILALIKFIDKEISKQQLHSVSFTTQLLLKMITRQNTLDKGIPIYLWKHMKDSELKDIKLYQDLYLKFNLTDVLFKMFLVDDEKICEDAVQLAIAFLYGGNEKVQESFYRKFLDDEEDKVFNKIKDKLINHWEIFRKNEIERLNYLYSQSQKSLFEHLKLKATLENATSQELQDALKKIANPKYLEPATKDPNSKSLLMMLTLIQTLCEKQFKKMQEYLRNQKIFATEKQASFDYLNYFRRILANYSKFMSQYNIEIGGKVIEIINEMIQGEAEGNIKVLMDKTFIFDSCKVITDYNDRYHLLPRGFGLDPFHEDFRNYKAKFISAYKTILETRNPKFKVTMLQYLDLDGLIQALELLMRDFLKKNSDRYDEKDIYKRSFRFSLHNKDFVGSLGVAIKIYIIFRYIWEDREEFEINMKELIEKNFESLEYGKISESKIFMETLTRKIFPQLVHSIEIVDDTKKIPLIRIWFPKIAMSQFLTPEAKKRFLDNADRTNSQTKIDSLLDSANELITQMRSTYTNRRRFFGISYRKAYHYLNILSQIFALTIVGLNLGTLQYDNATQTVVQDEEPKAAQLALNIIQVIISFILLVLWITAFKNKQLALKWDNYNDHYLKTQGDLAFGTKKKLEQGTLKLIKFHEFLQILKAKGPFSDEFKIISEKMTDLYRLVRWQMISLNFWFSIASPDFIWKVIYFGICIGSLFHPIVTAFQLLDIALRSTTVIEIYFAIRRNRMQFFWTLYLLAMIVLFYAFIGLYFLNGYFNDGGDPANLYCTHAFDCFIHVMNRGLRPDGGVGDTLVAKLYTDGEFGRYIARVIYDFTFFIISKIILLNLIFGMIIDAFGDIRDQKNTNAEDQNNICFICGIERAEFERHMKFDDHIKHEHKIWSYVYYIAFLKNLAKHDKNDMNDIENHIWDKINLKSYDWIPIGCSVTLQKIKDLEDQQKEDNIELLRSKIDKLNENTARTKYLVQDAFNTGQ